VRVPLARDAQTALVKYVYKFKFLLIMNNSFFPKLYGKVWLRLYVAAYYNISVLLKIMYYSQVKLDLA